jgi:spermidine synthase
LSKSLLLPDAKIIASEPHPLGRLDVVEAPALRVAPGLSLAYRGPMPRQQALFVNGDGPSALLLADPRSPEMAFLDWMPSALPYHLAARLKVLVIGAGGGLDMMQAIRLGRKTVVGLESHPGVASYVRRASAAPLDVRITEARGFVRATDEKFDLIQVSLLESSGSAGAYSLQENYLYTVEAIRDYMTCLRDDGMLAITRWLKTPPRDEIRMFATAVRALEARDALNPGDHLLFARGMQTGTMVVKRSPLTTAEIEAARRFCDERWFDLDYFPGMRLEEATRYNVVANNLYALAFRELVSRGRAAFLRDYAFDVSPTTDNRPFFSQFFRWQRASDLWRLLRTQALPLVEWGYIVSLATLIQTIVLSVLLIGSPLLATRRSPFPASQSMVFLYFAMLGLGFMLVEMAMLQKFVLFLAHPIYSASVVIASFLMFAGIGSATAWMRSPFAALCAIFIIGAFELLFLPGLFQIALAAPPLARVAIVVVSIAPLGLFMGMPFPLALRRISVNAPSLVPWAWGINGCLSVVAVSLAPLLAIHFGFNIVIALGLGCYFIAALVCDRGVAFRGA